VQTFIWLDNMKRPRKTLVIAVLALLTPVILVVGFKGQQEIAPFRGRHVALNGSKTTYRYYVALSPSAIRMKWGSGIFSRVEHGKQVMRQHDGTIRGEWTYEHGIRHGEVRIYDIHGKPWQSWIEDHQGIVRGTFIAHQKEAEIEISQQHFAR
jgi:hypothetical protein